MIAAIKWWGIQVARAGSRLLNALAGGEGDTTFSAYSWQLARKGTFLGDLRVSVVDWIFGDGHCRDAWQWHHERRLFEDDL